MSSVWTITFLNLFAQKLAIYFGSFMLIAGVLGGILTIVVFLSLKTFRQNSCSFYLIIMAFFNIVNLLFGLFSRIVISGFGIDWTLSSPFYCAFRWFCISLTVLTSFTMISFATIDQYLATSTKIKWQSFCNIRLARRLSVVFISIWTGLASLYLIYFKVIYQNSTNKFVCTSVNSAYLTYHTYVYNIVLAGFLPISITTVFGLLAYRNVRQLPYRTVPLVRRELDKQLTTMVLVQVIHNIFATLPYSIVIAIIYGIPPSSDSVFNAKLQFSLLLTIYLYYLNYASPFYIYICSSERFRHQLLYVLFDMHLKRWRRRRTTIENVETQF